MRRQLFGCFAMLVAVAAMALAPMPASAGSPARPGPASTEAAVSRQALWRDVLGRAPGHQSRSGGLPVRTVVGCGATWRVVDNQNAAWNNFLSDVSSLSPTDVWAVGSYQDQVTGLQRNSAQWWDGTQWADYPMALTGDGSDYMNAVDAIDSTHIFAVGVAHTSDGIPEGSFAQFYEGYNGGGEFHTYDPTPTKITVLNGVADTGLSNVMMVGGQVGVNGSGTYVWQTFERQSKNGAVTEVAMPNSGTGDNILFGITAVSSNDIWAVGYYTAVPGGARRTLILHSTDGVSWSPNFGVNAGSGDNTLVAVAGSSATDAWAIGYTGSVNTARFLLEHWDGIAWTVKTVPNPGAYTDDLSNIISTGSGHYEAVGFYGQTKTSAFQPLVATYDGLSWSTSQAARTGTSDNVLLGITQPAAGDVWAVGTYVDASPMSRDLTENYSSFAQPTGVSAVGGDSSATVSWSAPCGDGGSAITAYKVTAYDGCTVQGAATVTGAPPAAISGLTNGVNYTFKVTAVNGFGYGPQSAASPPVSPNGPTKPQALSVCSSAQQHLTASDGRTWQPLDPTNLSVSFTPAADSYAVIGGNADLWTANPGFNQDIGIDVGGTVVSWKESGGASTFTPNAAYVQAVLPVAGSTTYTAKLVWKTNRPDAGTVYAGAGPIGGSYSPTRMTVRLIPRAPLTVITRSSTKQYSAITGAASTSWLDIDSSLLKFDFTPPAGSWTAFVSGNADLWTSYAHTNQDLGVAITGGTWPAVTGRQPQSWKESGGAAPYSPNAAFVQGLFPVVAGTTYTAELQWKSNVQTGHPIWAGAGPLGGAYSPTSLTVILVPATTSIENAGQFTQPNSDGQLWEGVANSQALILSVTPAVDSDYELSVSADLWTAVAGYNQDLSIEVYGGIYGAGGPFEGHYGAEGTIVAWKESGGGAAYSPNAAFGTVFVHLKGGQQYWVVAMWKANRLALVSNAIYAAAGPEAIANIYSQSWLVATQVD